MNNKKYLPIIASTFFISSLSFAGCDYGNCSNGTGVITEGVRTYAGEFRNGVSNGSGVERIENSDGHTLYNGNFYNGKYSGPGVYCKYRNGKTKPICIYGQYLNGTHVENTEILITNIPGTADVFATVKTVQGLGALTTYPYSRDQIQKMKERLCSQEPENIGCMTGFVLNEPIEAAILIGLGAGLGYLAINSRDGQKNNSSLSIRDISKSIDMISDLMKKKSDERGIELGERIARKLGFAY